MPNPVDSHVGGRIRFRRSTLEMTQSQLSDCVGVKFQQIQKYETGANRVSASRMWDIAIALNVPVTFFFEGLDGRAPAICEAQRDALDHMATGKLVCYYSAIPQRHRKHLLDLARILGNTH